MSFQDNLKKYRLAAGYQQAKDFALSIGLKYSTYAGYESQGKEPKYETLCKIAAALGVTPDKLLGYSLDEYQYYKAITEKAGLQVNEYPPDAPGHDVIEVSELTKVGERVLAGYLSKKDYISTAQKAYSDYEKKSIPVLRVSLKSAFLNDFFGYGKRQIAEAIRIAAKPVPPKE